MTVVVGERSVPGGGSGPVRRGGRRGVRRWLPFVFLLLSVVLLAYPVFATQHNNARQDRLAEGYHAYVSQLGPEERARQLAAAREYNETHLGGPILDPWLARVSRDNAPYKDYLEQLSGPDGVMARVVIPVIDVNLPVYHGTDEDTLQRGVGHLYGSALPVGGVGTHSVLTGHTGLGTSTLFDHLTKVKVGDAFYIEVMGEKEKYLVDQVKVVLPEQTDDSQPVEGQDLVTLVTCTPYGVNSHRLLVRGHRVEMDAADVRAMDGTRNSHWSWWMFVFLGVAGVLVLLLVWWGLRLWLRSRRANNSDELVGLSYPEAAYGARFHYVDVDCVPSGDAPWLSSSTGSHKHTGGTDVSGTDTAGGSSGGAAGAGGSFSFGSSFGDGSLDDGGDGGARGGRHRRKE